MFYKAVEKRRDVSSMQLICMTKFNIATKNKKVRG